LKNLTRLVALLSVFISLNTLADGFGDRLSANQLHPTTLTTHILEKLDLKNFKRLVDQGMNVNKYHRSYDVGILESIYDTVVSRENFKTNDADQRILIKMVDYAISNGANYNKRSSGYSILNKLFRSDNQLIFKHLAEKYKQDYYEIYSDGENVGNIFKVSTSRPICSSRILEVVVNELGDKRYSCNDFVYLSRQCREKITPTFKLVNFNLEECIL